MEVRELLLNFLQPMPCKLEAIRKRIFTHVVRHRLLIGLTMRKERGQPIPIRFTAEVADHEVDGEWVQREQIEQLVRVRRDEMPAALEQPARLLLELRLLFIGEIRDDVQAQQEID